MRCCRWLRGDDSRGSLRRYSRATGSGCRREGRGPLAGDVVAAAVILTDSPEGVTDSKMLTPERREALAERIRDEAVAGRWAAPP